MCCTVHASADRVYGIALYLRLALAFQVMRVPVRGVGLPSIGSFRERWSLRKASRLQMVTLSQPATHPFRRGYANTCQSPYLPVDSTEAIPVANEPKSSGETLTVDIPQAYRPDRSTHRFTIQANAEVAAPESRGQR